MTAVNDVTALLHRWGDGDGPALEALTPIVYRELRRIARSYMRNERPDHTLEPTALVHEAYLRLVQQDHVRWKDRAHFLGFAARLMRQILVDHARKHGALKRGGGLMRLAAATAESVATEPRADIVAVDEALRRLAVIDPRKSTIVELRFFGGLSVEETAEVVGFSVATVRRDLRMAEAWLCREVQERAD